MAFKFSVTAISALTVLFYAPTMNGGAAQSTSTIRGARLARDAARKIDECLFGLQSEAAEVRCQACIAAASFGRAAKPAVPALTQLLGDRDETVRIEATRALASIGPAAAPAVPALTDKLRERNRWIREWAAVALGNIGPDAKEATPALIKATGDTELGVQRWSVCALRKIGPDAKAAIPALTKLLTHPDRDLRTSATWALGAVGAGQPDVVAPALAAAWKDEIDRGARFPRWQPSDPADVHEAMAASFLRLGRAAVPTLSELVKLPKPDVRWYALDALGRIGPDARPAFPALLTPLHDDDIGVRAQATRVLPMIGAEPGAAIPLLLESLKDESDRVRIAAVEALASYGPKAATALPALMRNFRDRSSWSCAAAGKVLVAIGAPAAPPLIEALGDKELREEAAALLGKIGPPAKAAGPALAPLVFDEEPTIRVTAGLALWRIDPKHPSSRTLVASLIRELRGDNDIGRAYACNALGELGDLGLEAKAAIPALIDLLRDRDSSARDYAAEALGNLGPAAIAAVPALVEALQPANTGLAQKARVALKQIDSGAAQKAGTE